MTNEKSNICGEDMPWVLWIYLSVTEGKEE